MAHEINNPQQQGNGIVDLVTTDDASYDTGTIEIDAKCIAFFNNGDGAGSGSAALVGVQGKLVPLPVGVAKNYPVIMGPNGVYKQVVAWNAQGNELHITVVY